MKYLGRKAVVLAAVVLTAASLGGCGKLKNTDIVATVGKEDVTVGVANFYARMQQAQYETYYASYMGDDMWATEVDEKGTTYESSTKDNLLTSLENMYLLEQHASDYEVTLSDEEKTAIDKAASDFIAGNALEDKEIVSGDEKYVKIVLELLTYQSKLQEPMKAGVDEEVSDEDAAQKSMKYVSFLYTKKDDSGQSVDMTDDEKKAQKEAAQKFVDGIVDGDLDAAASAAGVEAATATFDSETTTPNADVIAAADAVETEGGVTKLIETDSGCYVCKVTSFLDRAATDTKKSEIVTQRKQDQYDKILAGWRDDTKITEHKKVWNEISFIDQGVTMKQETEEPYAVGSDSSTTSDDEASSDK